MLLIYFFTEIGTSSGSRGTKEDNACSCKDGSANGKAQLHVSNQRLISIHLHLCDIKGDHTVR